MLKQKHSAFIFCFSPIKCQKIRCFIQTFSIANLRPAQSYHSIVMFEIDSISIDTVYIIEVGLESTRN